MTTIYIDVYFLINFTVDILALYFGASFSKTPTSVKRLIIGALIGALYAVLGVLFIDRSYLMYPMSVLFIIVSVYVVAGGVSFYRKVKFTVSFLLFEILIGGLVYYGYLTLDRFAGGESVSGVESENKNLLILSLLVLLSIGVIKLALLFFGNIRSEKNARLSIVFSGRESYVDALVDSGNLALDPLDSTPVMLITEREGRRIFGADITEPSGLDYALKRKIRIIPVRYGENQSILYAIKPEGVYALTRSGKERISVVVAVDRESRGYGGYKALLPLSAIDGTSH